MARLEEVAHNMSCKVGCEVSKKVKSQRWASRRLA